MSGQLNDSYDYWAAGVLLNRGEDPITSWGGCVSSCRRNSTACEKRSTEPGRRWPGS